MLEVIAHWFFVSLGLCVALVLWVLLVKPVIQATSVTALSLYVGMNSGLKWPGFRVFSIWRCFFVTMFRDDPLSVSGRGWCWRGVFKWQIGK